MSRLLGVVLLYALMFLAWTGVGLFMLLAPVRFGNLIHDSFGLLPPVASVDRGKKLVLRLIGVALLGFAEHFARTVAALVQQGG
jgi:hypothetical protein